MTYDIKFSHVVAALLQCTTPIRKVLITEKHE